MLFLTSINNYNFYNKKIFNIDIVEVTGFSVKKNNMIKNQIKNVDGENIFFIKKRYFKKFIDRNDTKYLIVKKIYPNKLMINFIPAKPICIIVLKDYNIIIQ